ncbi:MAG: hypothetical protein ACKVQU_20800 [Burkholderiales bacterium]
MTSSTPQGGRATDEAPASIPQTIPRGVGYGHPEFNFIQGLMEVQKALGEIHGSIADLKKSVDGTKSKVDDLVAWKNKILGGAIVLGVVASGLGFVIAKFSDYVTIKPPSSPAGVTQVSPKGK